MITQIGTIANYYGGLYIMKDCDLYYWSIENWDGSDWVEITKELYDSLFFYEQARLTLFAN